MAYSTFVKPVQEHAEDSKEAMPGLIVAAPESYWDGPHYTARKLYSPASPDEAPQEEIAPIS